MNTVLKHIPLITVLFVLTGCSEEAGRALGVAFAIIALVALTFIAGIICALLIGLRIAPKRTLLSFAAAIGTAFALQSNEQAILYAIVGFILAWIAGIFIFKKDKWKLFSSKGYLIFTKIISAAATLLAIFIIIVIAGAIIPYIESGANILLVLLFPLGLGVIGVYGLVKG